MKIIIKSNQEKKKIEGRVPSPENPNKNYSKIKENDIINFKIIESNSDFEIISYNVKKIIKYNSVKEMLKTEKINEILPGTKNIEEGIKLYHSFPNYKNNIKKYGIYAIHIKKI